MPCCGGYPLFDRRSGAFRDLYPLPGVVWITPPVVRDDGVWIALVEQNCKEPRFAVPRSVAHWLPARDTVLYLGSMPV